MISRNLTVACPDSECGAGIGEQCYFVGSGKPRGAPHACRKAILAERDRIAAMPAAQRQKAEQRAVREQEAQERFRRAIAEIRQREAERRSEDAVDREWKAFNQEIEKKARAVERFLDIEPCWKCKRNRKHAFEPCCR